MEKRWISFKQILMSHLSARSNLVNFYSKKNLTSNGCKPIRVLTRWTSLFSNKCLPKGYLICNLQPHRSSFLNRFTSLQFYQKEGGRHVKKNRAHKTFGPVKIISNDQATCYLVFFSQFRSTFNRLPWRRKKSLKIEL